MKQWRLTLLGLVICSFFLISCTVPSINCEPGQLATDMGQCCTDSDANGVCDSFEQTREAEVETNALNTTNVTHNSTIIVINTTTKTGTQSEPGQDFESDASKDAIELYLERYDSLKTMDYILYMEGYGDVWVWHYPDHDEYIARDMLFEVGKQGLVKPSQFSAEADSEAFINGIEDRNLHVMNYLIVEGNSVRGCYIHNNRYSWDNCITDYPNNNPITHGPLAFDAPLTAREWLEQYGEREPSSIRPNRTYRDDEGNNLVVDEVWFDDVKFLVHKEYGAPLHIEQFRDGRLINEVKFEEVAFNRRLPLGVPRVEEE